MPKTIGDGLYLALPTVTFAAGAHLEPGTVYEYNLEFLDGGGLATNLDQLGLLSNERIGGHPHLALGYDEHVLPTFVTPARDAAGLTLAHGSCRRPYAQGLDGLVALDQVIEHGREAATRPQYLFLTGDQIYADDLSNEMLAWANDAGVKLVGINSSDEPVEQLRVELPVDTWTRTVAFNADRLHFPPGRRARICGRAAGLTSDDNQNHALSFGEIAAHYLMSWSNVLWPKVEVPASQVTWADQYANRGKDVEAYLTKWLVTNKSARDALAQQAAPPAEAHLQERIERVDAWLLLPAESRAIDQFATPTPTPTSTSVIDDWNGVQTDWTGFWIRAGMPAPSPLNAIDIGQTSNVRPTRFPEDPDDLRDLAHLMTPAWYSGRRNFGVDHDYAPTDKNPPKPLAQLELYGDDVLLRLDRLRCFYEGLPYARRALANVSTLMMFDDHEVTDDFGVTQRWRRELSARALGRDVMTNALAAYLLFQDWGNDPDRYTNATPNREAFETIQQMFFDGDQRRHHGPEAAERTRLEQLFGFTAATSDSLLDMQVTWNFSLTDPHLAPYEILALDNRTRRGFDTAEGEPSDLSIEAIETQVPAAGPSGSRVTIVIAPLPVVGYPPMEEIAQPIAILIDSETKKHVYKQSDAFPNVELDYKFGKLVADPESWSFSTRAQEGLFARLASRRAVVLLSGDIHFSLTGKLTYWRNDPLGHPQQLVPSSRFVQLISSALKNEPGGMNQSMVQLGIAEQIGAIIGGPYDRLGWNEGGVNGPNLETPQTPHLLAVKLRKNPAVIPVRMLDDATKAKLRSRTLPRAPDWAWRFEVVKDLRFDDERYAPLADMAGEWNLPSEQDLADSPKAAFQQIANQHGWFSRFGMPRRSFFFSNIGLVRFEPETDDDATSPLEVVHSLYAWDRRVVGPRGTIEYDKPWPLGRDPAYPFTQYRVPLSFDLDIAPDQPEPTEPPQ